MTLSQPEGHRTLRIQLEATWDRSDTQAAIEDLFSVYLVDPQARDNTLIDRGGNGTSLFAWAGDQVELTPGVVRWDGSVLEIDTTEITDRNTGLLKLQLLRSDSDSGTRIRIRPLSNTVDHLDSRSASWTRDADPLASPQGTLAVAQLQTIDHIETSITNVRWNNNTQIYTAELHVHNLGQSLRRDLAVVLADLPAGVALSNASGTTNLGQPYLNLRDALPQQGLRSGMSSDAIPLVIHSPNRSPFVLKPMVIGALNRHPVLQPINPQTILPGGVLRIPLHATDPDGDRIDCSITSEQPLPTNVLEPDGTLIFRPNPSQLGAYVFQVTASDGSFETTQTVQLNVVADPITSTRVSGQILKVNSAPLVGVNVEIGSATGLTDNDGRFLLDLGHGPLATDTIRIRGEQLSGSSVFPFIAEKLPLVLGHDVYQDVNNVIDRPIYLPELDIANGKTINPIAATVVTTAAIPGAAVYVAAGTLMNQQSTPFTGVMSITEVPADLTPAALPPGLVPDLVVTIQPGEMTFTTPTPMALPNRGRYAPGSTLDLWSINPTTGQFDKVGVGQVSNDGSVIETTSGGIRNSSWHFFIPPPELFRELGDEPANLIDSCQNARVCVAATSQVELHAGTLRETHQLVSYQSAGTTKALTLHYDSARVDTRPIIHFGIDNANSGLGNRYLMARLQFSTSAGTMIVPGADAGAGLPGNEHFWKLPNGINDITVGLQGDLRSVPSGVISYSLTRGLLNRNTAGDLAGSMQDVVGQVVHVNAIDSPLGAGWQLAGLQQLVVNQDASVLLIDGDGTNLVFLAKVGQAGQYQSPIGDFSTLVRNPNGSFTRTFPDQTVVQFDSAGKLLTRADRIGNTIRYEYTAEKLAKIIDQVGLETSFAYDSQGRVRTITDPAGRSTQLTYDASGNLVSIVDPDGAQRAFQYDADHHMTGEVDRQGVREQSFYGTHGRIERVIRKDGTEINYAPVQTQRLFASELTSDPDTAPSAPAGTTAIVAQTLDANGQLVETTLDRFGQSTEVSDAIGSGPTTERNSDNQIITTTLAGGASTYTSYDARGNVVSLSDDVTRDALTTGGYFAGRKITTQAQASQLLLKDVNGDQLLDLIALEEFVSGQDINITVWLRQDDSTFRQSFQVSSNSSVLINAGDINGDGKLDLVTDRVLFLGNGDGTFGTATFIGNSSNVTELVVTDINNDGAVDIVTSHSFPNAVRILINAGGSFPANLQRQINLSASSNSVAVGDFNSDGLLDIAAALTNAAIPQNEVAVFLQGSGGSFLAPERFQVGGGPFIIRAADLDGDGDRDLVTSNRDNTLSVLLTQGDGTFLVGSMASVSFVSDLQLQDVDADEHLDIVTVGSQRLSVFHGRGDGSFQSALRSETGSELHAMALEDINHDGLADAVVATGLNLWPLLGLGDGRFDTDQPISFPVGQQPREVAAGDLNRDGLMDLVVANFGASNELGDVSVLLSTGGGRFADERRLTAGFRPVDLAIVDFNNDQVADLAIANNENHTVSVMLGRGDGSFSSQQLVSVSRYPNSIRTLDVNRDGQMDFVTVSGIFRRQDTSFVSVRLGNGDGTFRSGGEYAAGDEPQEIIAADLNEDGILDLIVSNFGDFTCQCTNDLSVRLGSLNGTFGAETRVPVGRGPKQVATADMDEDGHLDLLVVNSRSRSISYLKGRGDGTFLPDQPIASTANSNSITVGDINRDGHLDFLTESINSTEFALRLGRGDGTFESLDVYGVGRTTTSFSAGLIAADVTDDEILDVVTVSSDNRISIIPGHRSIETSIGMATHFAYEAGFNQLTKRVDELGHTTLYEIDPANGNVLAQIKVVGEIDTPQSQTQDDVRTVFTYNSSGLVASVVAADGMRTTFEYDPLNRKTRQTLAAGTALAQTTQFEYDTAGNVAARIDANSQRTDFVYDVMNRLIEVRLADPDGTGPLARPISKFEYDRRGNPVRSIDPLGNAITQNYDALDRPTRTTNALGQSTLYEYDRNGNLIRQTDAAGNVQQYAYDQRNRRISETAADGGRTLLEYDSNDHLIATVDPLGNRSQAVYDLRGRKTRERDALGASTDYQYDAANRMIESRDRNGRRTRLTYDELGRLASEQWLDETLAVIDTKTYNYDTVDNLIAITSSASSQTNQFDILGRLTATETSSAGLPTIGLAYQYDVVGNILSATQSSAGQPQVTTSYTYDALNRNTSIVQSGPGATTKRVDMSYDALGRVRETARYADLNRTQVVARSTTTWDAAGRMTQLEHGQASARDLAFYELGYTSNGRLRSLKDVDGLSSFATNAVGAITGVTRGASDVRGNESYRYDLAGNRLLSHLDPSGVMIGSANRLLEDAEYRYQYDDEGNLVRETEKATGVYRKFAYNHRNQLTSILTYSVTDVLLRRESIEYNALGQRISRTVDANGDEPGGETIYYYVYDRGQVVAEYLDADGSGSQAAQVNTRNLFSHQTGTIVAQDTGVAGLTHWLLSDPFGSVRDVLGSQGASMNHIVYDTFGNMVSQSNPATTTQQFYAGLQFDPATELASSSSTTYRPRSARRTDAGSDAGARSFDVAPAQMPVAKDDCTCILRLQTHSVAASIMPVTGFLDGLLNLRRERDNLENAVLASEGMETCALDEARLRYTREVEHFDVSMRLHSIYISLGSGLFLAAGQSALSRSVGGAVVAGEGTDIFDTLVVELATFAGIEWVNWKAGKEEIPTTLMLSIDRPISLDRVRFERQTGTLVRGLPHIPERR